VASISDEQRELILSSHRNGLGRNAIAKIAGVSPGSVSSIVKASGGSFGERVQAMEQATKTRKVELAEKRSALELDLLNDARRLRSLLWKPMTYIDHGGKEFTEVTWEQPTPSPSDQLKLMQAAGLALDKSLRITEASSDQGVEQAKSMLAGLAESLASAWTQIQQTEEPQ